MNAFARDILSGLRSSPKRLPSKYFYDAAGDELFRKIMELPEYYLTRAEHALLESRKEDIGQVFEGRPFDIIEPGAGSGEKTRVLLRHFLTKGLVFRYLPIDISPNALELLREDLEHELPGLEVQTLAGDYFRELAALPFAEGRRRLVLFLGSNIGNYTFPEAEDLLRLIAGSLRPGDLLLIGFDMKKDPARILAAYDDAAGVTRDFNLNLLTRINRELGADFDRSAFRHWAVYNPLSGACESYLVSLRAQTVRLKALGEVVRFEAWEAIYMELSQKYDIAAIEGLAAGAGFGRKQAFFDEGNGYLLDLWERD